MDWVMIGLVRLGVLDVFSKVMLVQLVWSKDKES
jgi:hypothetical protein